MKIYDFDEKFYDYVRTWRAMHPGMTEKQVEESYNEIMLNWLNVPASWLNGEKPGEYFMRYSDPKDLLKLLELEDRCLPCEDPKPIDWERVERILLRQKAVSMAFLEGSGRRGTVQN